MSDRHQENSRHLPIGTRVEAQFEGSGLTGMVDGYGFSADGRWYYLVRLDDGIDTRRGNMPVFVSLLVVHENNLEVL